MDSSPKQGPDVPVVDTVDDERKIYEGIQTELAAVDPLTGALPDNGATWLTLHQGRTESAGSDVRDDIVEGLESGTTGRRLSGLDLRTRNDGFTVLATGETCQIAFMALMPGQDSGENGNEHPESDQVLTVTAGSGEVVVSGETVMLGQGDTVLIRAGEDHLVRNTGQSPLRTLNVYSPPAY